MRSIRSTFRVLAPAAVLLISACSAFGFPAVQHHHKRDVRAEVQAIDEQWRAAQLANDAVAADKLLSDDYLGITGNGQVVTKAQQLERIQKRSTNLTKLDISDVKIKLVGAVAIVTSLADLEGTLDNHSIHGSFRSTRVYQRLPGGAWKITSFEATPLRQPGGGHDREQESR